MISEKNNILIYYEGMRSYLIYENILNNESNLIDTVIEMPALPYNRKNKKRNYSKIIKSAIISPGYFFIQFLTIYVYKYLGKIFKNTIKDICLKKNINYFYFEKIDSKFINFVQSQKPTYIISSTSSLLPEELLNIPLLGTINFHEAPLPSYRGSAAYFWFRYNNEKTVWVTIHYVEKDLDSGEIICTGEKINIENNSSIFFIWRTMLISYKYIWEFITPYFYKSEKLRSQKQNNQFAKTYSYPDKELNRYLKKRKIRIFTMADFIFILRVIVLGKIY